MSVRFSVRCMQTCICVCMCIVYAWAWFVCLFCFITWSNDNNELRTNGLISNRVACAIERTTQVIHAHIILTRLAKHKHTTTTTTKKEDWKWKRSKEKFHNVAYWTKEEINVNALVISLEQEKERPSGWDVMSYGNAVSLWLVQTVKVRETRRHYSDRFEKKRKKIIASTQYLNIRLEMTIIRCWST